MSTQSYLVFKNINALGKATDGPPGLDFNSFDTYHPVLKFESELFDTSKNKIFIPGYACRNKGFYSEELKIGYVTLISAQVKYVDTKNTIGFYKAKHNILELGISDKYNNYRKICLNYRDSKNQLVPCFIDYINFINILIDTDIDINKIQEEELSNNIYIQKPFKIQEHLFSIYSSLSEFKIKKIEKSLNRIGKDNLFWTEYILENLNHRDEYIESILYKAVGEAMDFHLDEQRYYAYAPSCQDNISDIQDSTRQFIAYHAYHLTLGKYYNMDEHKFYRYRNWAG